MFLQVSARSELLEGALFATLFRKVRSVGIKNVIFYDFAFFLKAALPQFIYVLCASRASKTMSVVSNVNPTAPSLQAPHSSRGAQKNKMAHGHPERSKNRVTHGRLGAQTN